MTSPLMNDITTNPVDPPQFSDIARKNPKRTYDYPERFQAMQAEHYSDIAPLVTEVNSDDLFAVIRKIAGDYSWEIVSFDAKNYILEAVAKTKLLRFRDDIVVEIRNMENGNREVHMRSKSPMGRNDFGANAARIRKFLGELSNTLSNR